MTSTNISTCRVPRAIALTRRPLRRARALPLRQLLLASRARRAPRERLAGALPRGAVALPPEDLQSRYESDASPWRRMWRGQRGSSEPSVSRCALGEGLRDDDEHCHGHENGAQQLQRAKRRSATATPTTMATRARSTTMDSCAYPYNRQGYCYLGSYRYSSKNPRSLGQVP